MTDDDFVPPFDGETDPEAAESFDDLIWDAVPVDSVAPAPPAVEAPAESSDAPVPIHEPYTPPAAEAAARPVSLHVEQSDVG